MKWNNDLVLVTRWLNDLGAVGRVKLLLKFIKLEKLVAMAKKEGY